MRIFLSNDYRECAVYYDISPANFDYNSHASKTTTSKPTKTTKTTKTSKTSTASIKPSATGLDALIKVKGKNYIGVAVDYTTLQIPEYEAIAKEEFGSITAEWSMKVIDITDPVDLRQVITEHITTYARRYAGKIEAWDVVNEVFLDDGSWRETNFYNVLGPEYVEIAFRAARAGDPYAKLCINDFNLDWDNGKVNSTIKLVNDLRAKGVPIDCIGTQGHLVLNSEDNPLLGNIWGRLSNETGLEVQVTELDIRMVMPTTPEKLADQRVDYQRAVSACMKNKHCSSITIWAVTDGLSWVPHVFPEEGAPLLWDENYQKKPAYYGVIDGFNTV
ncbi:Exoglucanase [Dactylella cylindrospora]|nr:Exoglucanase [Dactylella cylindrospora]